MGSIHHLIRYIPNLAQTAADLHPMLKNTEKFKPNNWTPERNKAFSSIKKLVSTITQKEHFDQHLDILVVCEATTSGLGASQ